MEYLGERGACSRVGQDRRGRDGRGWGRALAPTKRSCCSCKCRRFPSCISPLLDNSKKDEHGSHRCAVAFSFLFLEVQSIHQLKCYHRLYVPKLCSQGENSEEPCSPSPTAVSHPRTKRTRERWHPSRMYVASTSRLVSVATPRPRRFISGMLSSILCRKFRKRCAARRLCMPPLRASISLSCRHLRHFSRSAIYVSLTLLASRLVAECSRSNMHPEPLFAVKMQY
jgi:hypothetical protein